MTTSRDVANGVVHLRPPVDHTGEQLRLIPIVFCLALISSTVLAQDLSHDAAPSRLDATFGKGVTVTSGDGRFTLQLRGRAQLR